MSAPAEADTGETVLSCTMIVTGANAAQAVHNRMPVLLDRPEIEAWLTGAARTCGRRPKIASACGRYRGR
jgi:putative SOS response-associated peptidase YedK